MTQAAEQWFSLYADRIGITLPGQTHMLPDGSHLAGGRFGSAVHGVRSALRAGAEAAQTRIEHLHPEVRVRAHYAANHAPLVTKAAKVLHRGLLEANKANQQVVENAIKAKDPIDGGRLAVTITLLQSKKPAEIIDLMLKDRTIAAIAIENYALVGLPESAKHQIIRNVAEKNIARNFEGTAAAFPTLDDMLGERPGVQVKAQELAAQTMRDLDTAKSEIDTHASWLGHVINHTAIMASASPAGVWDMMQKEAA